MQRKPDNGDRFIRHGIPPRGEFGGLFRDDVGAQQRQVVVGIKPDHLGRSLGAAGRLDRHRMAAGNDVGIGHQRPVRRDEETGSAAADPAAWDRGLDAAEVGANARAPPLADTVRLFIADDQPVARVRRPARDQIARRVMAPHHTVGFRRRARRGDHGDYDRCDHDRTAGPSSHDIQYLLLCPAWGAASLARSAQ